METPKPFSMPICACDSRSPAITVCFFTVIHWAEQGVSHGRFFKLLNASFQVKPGCAQPQPYSKSSMSALTCIVFLMVLISLSHGSPLSASPLNPGTAKSWTNATYVSSIDQCPPLSPRRTPPTSVHDLLAIATSMRLPLLIGFS
jgi:hypothetical protein